MLKRFEVENFKGFKDNLVFDLKAGEYEFNKNLVVDGIVNKAIIYGKNGTGKSNLGIAIFDIIMHLTDKQKIPGSYLNNFLNLNSTKRNAKFKYYFQFDDDEVEYEYEKDNFLSLIYERLIFNKKEVLYFNYFERKNNHIDLGLDNLKIDLIDNKLSVIKYIYRNTPTNQESLLYKMMYFVDHMLWYRSLTDGNEYCGFTNGSSNLVEKLYETGKKDDFVKFLEDNDLHYSLDWINEFNGQHNLVAKFADNRATPFVSIASTGTRFLFLYFIWSNVFSNISFLFIDEFDAFLHYEAAADIVSRLNKNKKFQSVLTSHNTYLMQNKLTRPDCCFVMTPNKITNLCNSTDKEIREAHNLEKMYINGAFNK